MIEMGFKRADGRILCRRCRVADSRATRVKRLFGRRPLADGEGVFLGGSGIVHTSLLRAPIDAIFVDEEFSVLEIRADVKPWRLAVSPGAHGIIEVPAGHCARIGLRVGEQLTPSAVEVDGNGRAHSAGSDDDVRVLVATPDARFGKVAMFLLARQGFSVEMQRGTDRVVEAVRDRTADVVVLDGSGGIAAAARVTRAVGALDRSAGIVVVADEGAATNGDRRAVKALDVLPKWASFDEIVDAIRASYRRSHLLELE